MYADMNDTTEAIKITSNGSKSFFSKPWVEMGNEYTKTERYKNAVLCFRRALAYQSENAKLDTYLADNNSLWTSWGYILICEGRDEEAEKVLRKALVLSKKKANQSRLEAHCYLAILYRLTDRVDEAIHLLLNLLDNNPPRRLFLELTATYLNAGKRDEANKYLKKAIEFVQTDTFYNKACLMASLGRHDEALESLEEALKGKKPWDLDLRYYRRDPDLISLHNNPRFREMLRLYD